MMTLYLRPGRGLGPIIVAKEGDDISHQSIPGAMEHGVELVYGRETVLRNVVDQKAFQVGSHVVLEQGVDSLPKRLGMGIVIPGIYVAADQHRAVEKPPQPDVYPGLMPGSLDDVEDLLPGEKGEGQVAELPVLPLIFRVDIGNHIVHPLFLAQVIAPQRLPLVGIAAEPVGDDERAISTILG